MDKKITFTKILTEVSGGIIEDGILIQENGSKPIAYSGITQAIINTFFGEISEALKENKSIVVSFSVAKNQ